MKTPIFTMTPDYTPVVRMMAMQTRLAIETSQNLMKLAMMPWQGLPTGFGSICTPMGSVSVRTTVVEAEPVVATEPEAEVIEAEAVEVAEEAPVEVVEEVEEAVVTEAVAVEDPVAEPAAPAETETVETAAVPAEAPVAEKAAAEKTATEETAAEETLIKPAAMTSPNGTADDLTALNGVGPKLAEALNAEGIYTYAQIAAWTEANVAWIDENLPGVRGRASRNGWVVQAAELAK